MTDGPRWSERAEKLLVFGAALATSLVVTFVVFHSQGLVDSRGDPYSFSAHGKAIAHGNWFDGKLAGRKGPLYPAMIGGIYAVFGDQAVWAVQLVQCLLLAGTCLLAYDIGRRLYGRRAGLLAGLLCALHPSLLRYVPDFHLETLMTFLITLMVWTSVRFHERPTIKSGLVFGVVTGLSSLCKAVTLLYPLVFAVIWLLQNGWLRSAATRKLAALVPLATIFVAMGLTIAPWTLHNYKVSGHLVPVSTGLSDAFLRGYVFSRSEFATLRKPPYTDAETEVNRWFQSICAAKGVVWEQDAYETEKILNEVAKQKLLASPIDFVRKSVVGMFAFWYEMTSLKNSLVAGFLALVGWVLAAFGFRRARAEHRSQWLLLAPILYLNLFLAVLLALGRYSVPVLPCLMILAAFGIDTLLRRRASA